MKKNVSYVLIAAVVLLAAALVMMGAAGLNTKATEGGCAVRIEVGATYDAAAVQESVNAAGFNSPVVLETTETAIEIETGAMDAAQLTAAADKLLASVQADHEGATLTYAESFTAPEAQHHVRELVLALVAMAVVCYVYGLLRYGWRKAFAPVLTALVAAVVAGSVCVLLNVVFAMGTALTAVIAGTGALTYVYSVSLYNAFKANPEYTVSKADKAVPVLVVVAAVLLMVSTGSISIMGCAVVGSVVAAAAMYCVAPLFWKACTK